MTSEAKEAVRAYRRRREGPMWFRVLERFGLPTLFAVALLGYEFTRAKWDREDRNSLLAGLKAAVVEQTRAQTEAAAALRDLAREERAHADAVRLTWPRVRELPRSSRPEGSGP